MKLIIIFEYVFSPNFIIFDNVQISSLINDCFH